MPSPPPPSSPRARRLPPSPVEVGQGFLDGGGMEDILARPILHILLTRAVAVSPPARADAHICQQRHL